MGVPELSCFVGSSGSLLEKSSSQAKWTLNEQQILAIPHCLIIQTAWWSHWPNVLDFGVEVSTDGQCDRALKVVWEVELLASLLLNHLPVEVQGGRHHLYSQA